MNVAEESGRLSPPSSPSSSSSPPPPPPEDGHAAKEQFRQWARSFVRLDPRIRIHRCFQEIAQRGEMKLVEARQKQIMRGKQPSPQVESQEAEMLVSCFNMASVFTVWRPCSNDAIRKMMEGKGVGKGLDIKGKSAKTGKHSGYVPFLQIHNQADKYKIDYLPRDGRLRVFYRSDETRQAVVAKLRNVCAEMMDTIDASDRDISDLMDSLSEKDVHQRSSLGSNDNGGHGDDNTIADKQPSERSSIPASERSSSILSYEMASQRKQKWAMTNTNIDPIDVYTAQSVYGLEVPERLFWETFVMRQKHHCHLWERCSMEGSKEGVVDCEGGSSESIGNSFAEKLMRRILDITTNSANNNEDGNNKDAIIEWVEDAALKARSFIILDSDRFVQEVIRPIRENDTDFPYNFSSFVGRLRQSGFIEQTTGRGHVRFFHRYFQKNRIDLCVLVGSEHDTGRSSMPSLQDANFKALRKVPESKDEPRVVLWHLEEDGDDRQPKLCPHNLLMAYEEHGKVVPVVSDFDGFLIGTKRIHFEAPLPPEQVEMVSSEIQIARDILDGKSSGSSWAARWMDASRDYISNHPAVPPLGFGDQKSYKLMEAAVKQMARTDGAVRHGAECFNYTMPQEIDPSFLVISDTIEGNLQWQYVDTSQLHYFLHKRVDDGYTFPLNPKWILCDPGWYQLYEKMRQSELPNMKSSFEIWYPTESGIRPMIQQVQERHPTGLTFANSKPTAERKSDVSIVASYNLASIFNSGAMTTSTSNGPLLHICRGSVVDFDKGDCRAGLVCASNESCLPICGGVLQAVVEAGGKRLFDDASAMPVLHDTSFGPVRCVTGDAAMVSSDNDSYYGKLGVSHVIFAAGPAYGDTFTSESDVAIKDDFLISAYQASIQRAKEKNLQVLAFSLISAGKRSSRSDPHRALRMAIRSLSEFDEDFGAIEELYLCSYTAAEVDALEAIAKALGLQRYKPLP